MLTYFLVLLIPLALSGYSYFASYRIIEKEVQTSNDTSLKLMSSTLDQQVETASNIGNQLLSGQRLKQFINMQTPENYRTTYQTELIKLLTSYCRNAAISDITLYLPELGLLCHSPFRRVSEAAVQRPGVHPKRRDSSG